MSHWLFLPNDAVDDLETLAGLASQRIEQLREFLDSGEFRPRYSFYVRAADLLGISDESAAKLCTFIEYVQRQRTRNGKAGPTVPDELEHFLNALREDRNLGSRTGKLLKFVREHRADMAKLFSDLSEHDYSSKVRELEAGPLPHLKSFRAYCDLRPVYNAAADQIV